MSRKTLMFPADEPIVAMATFAGQMFIATSKAVYRLIDGKRLEPLQIDTDIPEVEQAHAEKQEAVKRAMEAEQKALQVPQTPSNDMLPEVKP